MLQTILEKEIKLYEKKFEHLPKSLKRKIGLFIYCSITKAYNAGVENSIKTLPVINREIDEDGCGCEEEQECKQCRMYNKFLSQTESNLKKLIKV